MSVIVRFTHSPLPRPASLGDLVFLRAAGVMAILGKVVGVVLMRDSNDIGSQFFIMVYYCDHTILYEGF